MPELTTPDEIASVLRAARTVAILGAHKDPSRAAYYVPDYLRAQGYRIVPVNPALQGESLFGEPVRGALAEIGERVDIVDVFRRPELLPGHLDDILAMKPLPAVVWLQLGIRNDAFARSIVEAGISIVQSRCTLADHRAMGVGRVA